MRSGRGGNAVNEKVFLRRAMGTYGYCGSKVSSFIPSLGNLVTKKVRDHLDGLSYTIGSLIPHPGR